MIAKEDKILKKINDNKKLQCSDTDLEFPNKNWKWREIKKLF